MNKIMNKKNKIDRLDKAIIKHLSKNGRLSVADIARRIGASKTPVQVRLKRLQEEKYILGFRAVLNPKKLEKQHIAFTEVKLSDTREKALNEFNSAVVEIPEIEQCHMIASSFDYLLKTRTKDITNNSLIKSRLKLHFSPYEESLSSEEIEENGLSWCLFPKKDEDSIASSALPLLSNVLVKILYPCTV